MNIRIATAFLLGLATMSLASLSCSAEEPAPTATPAPQASAQVLEQACAKVTASSHFDLVQTVTRKPLDGGESDGTESTLHVAGAEYHWTRESYDGTKFEGIYAGGVGYRRDGSSPWVEHKTLDHQSTAGSFGVDFTAQGWSICPQLDLAEDKGWVEKMGEENLDGVTTTVYATSHDVVAPSPTDANYTINVALHFWVDETGQLVQFRNVQRFPPSPVESIPGFTVSIVTKVSGVGEENVITAPVLGEGNSTASAQGRRERLHQHGQGRVI